MSGSFLELPDGCVPADHSRQQTCEAIVERFCREGIRFGRVLDLGCGDGRSIDFFRRVAPHAKWVGVDIEASPEVRSRRRADGEFHSFDGVHLPFADGDFDLVYCNQVFEHVRRPGPLLVEVARVLAREGRFIGSTSQLECYHSYSYWNYTPFGFYTLLAEAGLRLVEMRPGIDALTLILRRIFRNHRFFERFWTRPSPLNAWYDLAGRIRGRRHDEINARKLLTCGQFCFVAVRA